MGDIGLAADARISIPVQAATAGGTTTMPRTLDDAIAALSPEQQGKIELRARELVHRPNPCSAAMAMPETETSTVNEESAHALATPFL
jgi:hypothetical protein